jgi:hypothetical protein
MRLRGLYQMSSEKQLAIYKYLAKTTKTQLGVQRLEMPDGRIIYFRLYLEYMKPPEVSPN